MPRQPPISTLFPYTTLFRSVLVQLVLDRIDQGEPACFDNVLAHAHGPPHVVMVGRLDDHDVWGTVDRKSTRLNSSHQIISYAVFCLKKKINNHTTEYLSKEQ